MLQQYYRLSKPGIVYANIITALAGYLFASHFSGSLAPLAGLLTGLSLLIAGACAANNYLDRHIDGQMKRTSRRSLVTGSLSSRQALSFAIITALSGLVILRLTQNTLTFLLAVIAYVDYVAAYGFSKRKTAHGTLIGCISGAIPLVAGYTAVTDHLDIVAALLFTLMVVWQMGHFYGIALYRYEDYKAAGIPVMPVAHGIATTKRQAIGYMVLFIMTAAGLWIAGALGNLSGGLLMAIGAAWLLRSVKTYHMPDTALWGKQVFMVSLLVMLGMATLLAVGPLLA